MRLLYVVGQLGPGGLERQLWYLLQTMDRACLAPGVAVWNYEEKAVYAGRLQALGVPVMALSAGGGAARLHALRRLVRRTRPEVVHSCGFTTNFAAFWSTRRSGALAVGSVRSDFLRDRQKGGWRGRLNARWPRAQIFNSRTAYANAARTPGPFVPGRRFVVRNGLDLDLFRPAGRQPGRRPLRLIGVGSLYPVKRWDRLVEALALLRADGVDVVAHLVGEGPLGGELAALARQRGVADCFELVGYQADVAACLQAADVLVHTADTEGCPNAVMEAMACGLPVVVTPAGDARHLVRDGETGYLVPFGDVPALAARVAHLAADPSLRAMMGTRARAEAEAAFGLNRLVAETLAVYEALGWNPAGSR